MYAGHAAIALYTKARRPRLALPLLVVVAYAPDWIEWLIDASGASYPTSSLYSHSIPSVLLGSSVVAAVSLLLGVERADALALWLLYVSHWVADFFTGMKPTWPGGPLIGMHLYDRPLVDFVMETLVVAAAWIAYRRSLPPTPRRGVAVLIPAGLLVFQVGFLVIMQRLH